MADKSNPAEKSEVKRLFRSPTNKFVGGVCGGLSQYFGVDVAIIRILFVLFALIEGAGILIYLIALFVVPINPNEAETQDSSKSPSGSHGVVLIIGIILVLAGAYYTLGNFFYFPNHLFYALPFRLHWDLFWPILLILIGILYLVHISQKKESSDEEPVKDKFVKIQNGKKLLRSKKDKKIAGVCGGLAAYFEIDPTIVRILWAIATIFLSAIIIGIIVYIIMAIVVPEGDYE